MIRWPHPLKRMAILPEGMTNKNKKVTSILIMGNTRHLRKYEIGRYILLHFSLVKNIMKYGIKLSK